MRYPKDDKRGYFDASAMYGFEVDGEPKLCMFWGQGAPYQIGQWLCDCVRNTSKNELLRIASETRVYKQDQPVGMKMIHKLRESGFDFNFRPLHSQITWEETLHNNGWLLGAIDLGYPFTCDWTREIMASDWTYIIKINTINRVSNEQKKEQDGSRNDNGDISVRFVVYQMHEQNDDHFAKRSKEIAGDDILVNGTVPFEDILISKLPPVYVPPFAESLRYPNHIMRASYDYCALPADFSDDIWKRIGKQTDYICSMKERVV